MLGGSVVYMSVIFHLTLMRRSAAGDLPNVTIRVGFNTVDASSDLPVLK